MKYDGIAKASIVILKNILNGCNANKAVNDWSKSNRFAGSSDKFLIRDLVFSGLRRKKSCFFVFKKFGLPQDSRCIVIITVNELGYDIQQFFTSSKYGPKKLNHVEKEAIIAQKALLKKSKNFEKYDFPDFLENDLKSSLGIFFESFLEFSKFRAPLFIRINKIKTSLDLVEKKLNFENIKTKRLVNIKDSLQILDNHRKIKNSHLYKNGFFEIQDVSSQSVVNFIFENLKLQDNKINVLDYCAGSGGKTLALASCLKGNGNFFAYDLYSFRMKKLNERLIRNGVKCSVLKEDDIVKRKFFFDYVIVDVPCSGSGTWRRNPELKWDLNKNKLKQILSAQQRILLAASNLINNNGKIAYITCSVLDIENINQVNFFLDINKNFKIVKEKKIFCDFGGDGFYVAILKKNNLYIEL